YCVVAEESVPKNVSVAFLERLKDDFMKRYGGGKADTALAKCLNKEYGQVIKQHIQYVLDHSEELDKMLKVQAQVSEVKNIMLDSIEKTLGRGEKLSELQDKTSELHIQLCASFPSIMECVGAVIDFFCGTTFLSFLQFIVHNNFFIAHNLL
ncbi:hypothetical protein ACJX0J_030488, partial [Zea mays]